MTQDEQSAARMADRGDDWQWCDALRLPNGRRDDLRQALHDRDRFQRERDWWRELCINLTGEALA